MASRAFTARLRTTCSSWPRSARTHTGLSASVVRSVDVFPDQAGEHGLHLSHDHVQIHQLRVERLSPAEREQLPRQGGGPVRRLLDEVDVAPERVVRLESLSQELAAPADHRQEVVEVMRDASGKKTDGLHFSRLEQLLGAAGELLAPLGRLGFQSTCMGPEGLFPDLAPVDLSGQRHDDQVEREATEDRDAPRDEPPLADGPEQPLRRLVDLDHAQHPPRPAREDRDVDLRQRREPGPLVALLGLLERPDLDGDLAPERLLQLIVVGEPLPDELGLIGPEDRRVPVPDLDAHDLRETREEP